MNDFVVIIIGIIISGVIILKKASDIYREHEDWLEWNSNISNKKYDFTKNGKEKE